MAGWEWEAIESSVFMTSPFPSIPRVQIKWVGGSRCPKPRFLATCRPMPLLAAYLIERPSDMHCGGPRGKPMLRFGSLSCFSPSFSTRFRQSLYNGSCRGCLFTRSGSNKVFRLQRSKSMSRWDKHLTNRLPGATKAGDLGLATPQTRSASVPQLSMRRHLLFSQVR